MHKPVLLIMDKMVAHWIRVPMESSVMFRSKIITILIIKNHDLSKDYKSIPLKIACYNETPINAPVNVKCVNVYENQQ